MKTRDLAGLRAAFYLCLARAFMTPQSPCAFAAVKQYLVEDLAELNDTLDYPIVENLACLQHALSNVADHDALLTLYSTLFLNPASRIPINTGVYIDGAMMGNTVAQLEECYRNGGVEKSDGFFDLADHVAVQLEFVAHLFARTAEAPDEPDEPKALKALKISKTGASQETMPMQAVDFLHVFVAAWAPRLVEEIEQAGQRMALTANPYLALARILETVAEVDAADVCPAYARGRQSTAIEKARAKRATVGVTEEDMEFIELKLKERGLATEHLRVPLAGRDEARGWTNAAPPEVQG